MKHQQQTTDDLKLILGLLLSLFVSTNIIRLQRVQSGLDSLQKPTVANCQLLNPHEVEKFEDRGNEQI